MRVVAGSARGRKLRAPTGSAIRPTSDRVREAVFNMVGSRLDIDGREVLDLFAGTGALGIEALSRGAGGVTFVDRDTDAIEVIKANLDATGLGANASVVRADAIGYLSRGGFVDLALVDPPYSFDAWPAVFAALNASLVVAESDHEVEPGEGWEVANVRRHGTTVVTLVSPSKGRR